MKKIIVLLVINLTLAFNGMSQSYQTVKVFQRKPHQPIRASDLPVVTKPYSRITSSSSTHTYVREIGERQQPVVRYSGCNGNDIVVASVVKYDYTSSSTNQVCYVPTMVDGPSTAKAGTVYGNPPEIQILRAVVQRKK